MNAWILEREGPVALLTLQRPPINTLDRQNLEELAVILEDLEGDRETRALLITGGVEGIFCCGGDLKYWRQIRDGAKISRTGREVFTRIERLPQITFAAINGQAIGDGLTLALVCDFRIAAKTAIFRLPEVSYGFIPGWGLIHRLVALVGRANASELLLTGKAVDSAQARMIGLVNDLASPERLREQTLKRALELASLSPAALQAAKCALLGGDETACFSSVWGQADWREGIDAMLNKRPPVFASGVKTGKNCCQ